MLCYSDVVGIIGLSVYYTTLQKVNSMHMVFFFNIEWKYIYGMCIYMECREREREGERRKGLCQMLFTGADFPTVASLQLVTAVGLQCHMLP